MDPNEALRLIRAHFAQLRVEDETREDGWIGRLTQQGRDAAETFEGLDEWLSRDGFLPSDWQADEDKPSARTSDMPMGQVLNLAIFCINTFMHPDASRAEDIDELEARSDEVIEGLVELRNIYRATKAT
jgi:hypothetical protein